MTRGSFAYIKCDNCGRNRERAAASADLVAERAAERGWSLKENRRDGHDLCPDCVESVGSR